MIWILSIIGGIFYRLGGIGKPFNTRYRDLVLPSVALVALWLLDYKSSYWIAHLCSFGLMWGALSTYYDESKSEIKNFICKLINWQFPKDNLYMHGIGIGLALIPFWFFGMSLWLILTRAMVLGLGMGLVNKYVNKWALPHSDLIEEFFRGVIIIATLIIFI